MTVARADAAHRFEPADSAHARVGNVEMSSMKKLGWALVIFGAFCYLFAKLAKWSYNGGPASWSPKFYRAQEAVGIVLLCVGLPVLLIGLVLG
jgi:hypothetical protein